MKNEVYLIDNMEFMAMVPDKYYDLANVDPPYFDGPDRGNYFESKANRYPATKYNDIESWEIPGSPFFKEVERVSKQQIVWGCNYFDYKFGNGRLVWVKMNKEGPFSQCEIAYNSMINKSVVFNFLWNGFWQKNMKNKEIRIHQSQKPVALYDWTLSRFAKPDWKILDTHEGSGSHRIACSKLGIFHHGCEKDKKMWQAQEDRYREHIKKGPELFGTDEYQQLIYEQ